MPPVPAGGKQRVRRLTATEQRWPTAASDRSRDRLFCAPASATRSRFGGFPQLSLQFGYLVPQPGRVFESQLLGRLVHLVLEGHQQSVEIFAFQIERT